MSDGYDSYEGANADIGRVIDEIKEIDGVLFQGLEDTEHREGKKGELSIRWSEFTVALAVKPVDEVEDCTCGPNEACHICGGKDYE